MSVNKGFADENGHAIKDKEKNGKDVVFTVAKLPYSKEEEEEEDPWKVVTLDVNHTPWSELDGAGKAKRVLGYFIKVVLVIGFMYMFICSLDFLSSAFKLLGGEAAGEVFSNSDILSNPVAGVMMGVLVTVLVQSSSTSTSIVVSMVGADLLKIKTAIPIIMGANIGTSVTNTIVSIGQISDKGEFRRAFAGATVHDMFNWLTVIILLPIELITGYLFHLSQAIVDNLPLKTEKGAKKDILKVITKPFTELIVQVNKDSIKNIAKNEEEDYEGEHRILKMCCDKDDTPIDVCKDTLHGIEEDTGTHIYDTYFKNDVNQTGVCELVRNSVFDKEARGDGLCESMAWGKQKNVAYYQATFSGCSDSSVYNTSTLCCNTASTIGIIGSAEFEENSFNKTKQCEKLMGCATDPKNFDLDLCEGQWNVTKAIEKNAISFDCGTWADKVEDQTCYKECDYLFKGMSDLSDKAIGGILLIISLAILCICLVAIVKLLHSLLKGPMARAIKRFVNADFPGCAAYFTGYIAIILGAGFTFVVQSSSIFTSSITPLVGIGVIELDRMYPLTLGSNIGTTTTAILSALAQSEGSKLKNSLQVAFCHLFFNITGILIFYPFPFFRPPIPMAKFLGNRTARYRWFAIIYILLMFFAMPALVFGLSMAGWYVLLAIGGPIALIIIVITIIKLIQHKKPSILPQKLQNWKFLPKFLRSLEPYDRVMKKIFFCKRFQVKEDHPSSTDLVGYPNTRL